MADIKPFNINVSEESLFRLKQKLLLTDFPPELDDAGWTYGVPLYAPNFAFSIQVTDHSPAKTSDPFILTG